MQSGTIMMKILMVKWIQILFGKPTEGYGFSNNVIGTFGAPPFEKWLFEINGDKKIILKPTY